LPPKHLPVLLALLLWHGIATAIDFPGGDASQMIRTHVEALRIASGGAPAAEQRSVDALVRFYDRRAHAPAWSEPHRLAELVAQLETLADDGLRPDDYALAALRRYAGLPPPGSEARACADLLASRAYLDALAHLAFGRLERADVEPLWRFGPSRRAAIHERLILDAAAGADDVATMFARARPALPAYRALRSAYVALRDSGAVTEPPTVPAGPLLRPGTRTPRVAVLRERLAAGGYTTAHGGPAELYDELLAAAVVAFQRAHGLEPDGIVGPATLAALNASHADRLAQLQTNLERLRWLAGDLQERMVLVDIAGATITYYRDGVPAWRARTQVGRPARPTPLVKSQITHFTFNPTWTIPPTILRRDKLPEIRRDPEYLAKNRIRVLDHDGNEIDPATVDWERPGAVLLRQDAGEHNALGQVAIRFPNPYAVYLHDTPSQRLFTRSQRTFSSGCVRVERAMELVDLLLEEAGSVDRERIATLIASGDTRNVSLPRPVPLLMAYWTVAVDDDGTVRLRPDPYGHDAAIAHALAAAPPVDAGMPPCPPR
jgi:murein L,D-transpeptidase YcbB/YkuD